MPDAAAMRVEELGGVAGDEIQPRVPGGLQPEPVPVELVGCGVEHTVELEDGGRVLQLETVGDDGEPLLHGGFGLPGDLGDPGQLGLLLELAGEGVELTERVGLGAGEGRRVGLHLGPRDLGDAADVLAHRHRLLDHQVHADHGGEDGVLLGAEDVVDLLVDHREVLGDLVHGLLHGQLRHHARGARERCGVAENLRRCRLRELEDLRRLAVARHDRTDDVGG
jgi:hypothetical protein